MNKYRLPLIGVLALCAALLVSGCGSAEKPYSVEMTRTNSFSPAGLVVPNGATVIWKNVDHEVHSTVSTAEVALHPDAVVADGRSTHWDSADLPSSATWLHTFDTPGTYLYVCRYHPEMVGTILVTQQEE
ncbi:MAG: cupredoxin domain-containing protein [Chloroflexota bacterium]|nr:cupredoxin domain-containing protein [Chloroflexota bacterium]